MLDICSPCGTERAGVIKAVANNLVGGGPDAEAVLAQCTKENEVQVETRPDGITLYHFPTHELGQKKGSVRAQEGLDRKALNDEEMQKWKKTVMAVNWNLKTLTKSGGPQLALEEPSNVFACAKRNCHIRQVCHTRSPQMSS